MSISTEFPLSCQQEFFSEFDDGQLAASRKHANGPKMAEEDTNQIVDDFYRKDRDAKKIIFERKKSKDPAINALLKSKRGGDKPGRPEFILRSPGHVSWVMVVECKEALSAHQSCSVAELLEDSTLLKKTDYAVDGCIHYMGNLAAEFDVIGLAVSGKEREHKVSVFYQKKGQLPKIMIDPTTGQAVESLQSFAQYLGLIDEKATKATQASSEGVKRYAKELHEIFRNHFAMSELQKPLYVSALLLALQDGDFKDAYKKPRIDESPKTPNELIDSLFVAIRKVLENSNVPLDKREKMCDAFKFIANDADIKKINPDNERPYLLEILMALEAKVIPCMEKDLTFDLVGMFYGEFVRYTGGDGKGLGIVLTPRHITELMCKLARIDADSIVLDPCCGTGAFLITAMKEMIEDVYRKEPDVHGRTLRIANIQRNQLIGIETKDFLYTMAAANMIFRGDGKANLLLTSCFDVVEQIKTRRSSVVNLNGCNRKEIIEAFKEVGGPTLDARYKVIEEQWGQESPTRPNKCLMNPPYSQEKKKTGAENLHELDFIRNALDMLGKGGTLACIVPISVTFGSDKQDVLRRSKLLEKHRLDAVLSMPSDLFYPVGTHTCIMVFTAHEHHDSETWFAYCKKDGFVIDRVRGRADTKGKWPEILSSWVEQFRNRDIANRYFAVRKKVEGKDEWCAEAYIETDYHAFSDDDLDDFLNRFQLSLLNVRFGNI